ncbi:Sporulation related domain protein [Pelagimonas phthalicica]|uniref:Sporulation related domain protein n=1 Tax=Pelagimonas phthalicica TaxID=1037362 RepID=A0A238JB29_9RHOB|nr:SPOR domain-containing protein [Pelagimonas phthalicica]TDS93579.1 sporulation related protein [Pelagimonas phthalicica]SMX27900.1 Sporulation related domain protein [Pelagimonas phthalicica]
MSGKISPKYNRILRATVALTSFLLLSACADGQMPGFLQPKAGGSEDLVARAATSGATTERDVEAPDIFQATEAGLWDGRPSLGGVWVAHPDVTDPERAIIRNEANGKFVIGALFRRERQSPGPRLQVSSDAAAALGILAGQPTNLNVVALRREEVSIDAPLPQAESAAAAMPAAPEISEGTLDPVLDGASKAIETASLAPTAAPAAPAAKPVSSLSKPFIQIGIFSVEQNARNTATAMRQEGMVPTVKEQSSNGKKFWRVVVGPAQDKPELQALLKKIKGTGFTDAYAVTH